MALLWRSRLALAAGCLAFAKAVNQQIPGIPEHLQPPRHEALRDYEFLELLDVQRAPARPRTRWWGRPELVRAEGPFDDFSVLDFPGLRQMLRTLEPVLGEKLLLAEKTFWKWPFRQQEAEELGEGFFGVLYLSNDTKTGVPVAIKLFKSHFETKMGQGLWITPRMYHDPDPENEPVRELLNDSRDECINMQKIHEGDSKYPYGSRRVLKCYRDAITDTLNDPKKLDTPVHIVLEYAGRKNLENWWVSFQNKTAQSNKRKDYVNIFKMFTHDIFVGLRFLGENPTDTQWVHHDLKAPNMVVSVQPGNDAILKIVDLGTALSTKKPNGTSACTAYARPPEVCPFQVLEGLVGFQPPIWSYDVYSAAATVLGMATDVVYNEEVGGVGVLPYYFYHMHEIIQHSMIRVALLTEAIECGKRKGPDFATAFYACAAEMASAEYQALHRQRMTAIQGTQGEKRKAALASLINCRQTGISDRVLDPTFQLGEAAPSPFFWALLEQWMTTGFDDVLLSALSADPKQRPKPTEILEAKWFNMTQEVKEGSPVEFTCPEFGLDDGKKLRMVAIGVVVAEVFLCIMGCGAGALLKVLKKDVSVWKLVLPFAGVTVILVPIAEFYIVSWKYVWLSLMVPVGFAMLVLSVASLPQLQAKLNLKKEFYMGALALALLLLFLIFLDHTLMLWSWSWASRQLGQEPEKIKGVGDWIGSVYKFLNSFRSLTTFSVWIVLLAMASLAIEIRASRARDDAVTTGSANDIELPARDAVAAA